MDDVAEFGGFGRVGRPVGIEAVGPGSLRLLAGLHGMPARADLLGNLKGRMVPIQGLPGQGNFVLAQWGAVGAFLTLLVW